MAYASGQTEERHVKTMPGRAGAAILDYRILQAGTDPDEVIEATAGTQFPIGVSGNASETTTKASYEENDPVAVKYDGVVFVSMEGTGARGDRVMATTAGQGTEHTTEDGVYILGHATQAWADGDVIPVMIDRYYIGDFVTT